MRKPEWNMRVAGSPWAEREEMKGFGSLWGEGPVAGEKWDLSQKGVPLSGQAG